MGVFRAMWGFDGRIGRKVFWLAGLVWCIPFFVVWLMLLSWFSGGRWLDENYAATLDGVKATGQAELIALAIFYYPSLAMSIKRTHDLTFSAWWCIPAFALGTLYVLEQATGLTGAGTTVTTPGHVLEWSSIIVGLVYLIPLGFMRGTAGENRFGPDPLAKGSVTVAGQ